MAEQKQDRGGGGALRSLFVAVAAAAAAIGGIVRSCGHEAEEVAPALRQIAGEARDPLPGSGAGPADAGRSRDLAPAGQASPPIRPAGGMSPEAMWQAVAGHGALRATPGTNGIASKTYRLPVLSVLPDGTGECDFIACSFTRDPADRTSPLSIAIAEDTPGGAGESTRACVWLAAMVAGLERSDDLSGARVTLDLPGRVDGPSAGGVICLAILAAMDGRQLPADFAMTGTIMPDGTIGLVGGVAAKIRAAAKAGVRRVLLPAYLRFEQDAPNGPETDLKDLCRSLGVQFIPVEDIGQAYRALISGGDATVAAADPALLDLPAATEQLLKKRYAEDLAAGRQIWDAIPEDERQQIDQDEFTRGLFVREREKAEAAYHAGRLLYAAAQVARWRRLLEARAQNVAEFGALDGTDLNADLAKTDASLRDAITQMPDPMDLVLAARPKLPDAGLQLCSDWYRAAVENLARIGECREALDASVVELGKPENQQDAAKRKDLTDQAVTLRAAQLIYAHVTLADLRQASMDATALSATYPPLAMPADPLGAQRLFASAYQAAQHSFETDVVRTAADALQVPPEQALRAMAQRDESLRLYASYADVLQDFSQAAASHAAAGSGNARTQAAVLAYVDANALSRVSGVITRWSALDLSFDPSGHLVYRRTDLLNYLLRRARANALACIGQCSRGGIPCPAPLLAFERAEFGRDDNQIDKVDVLADYWDASLQAKVLLMLFQPDRTRAAAGSDGTHRP
jgi:hypothetical protein